MLKVHGLLSRGNWCTFFIWSESERRSCETCVIGTHSPSNPPQSTAKSSSDFLQSEESWTTHKTAWCQMFGINWEYVYLKAILNIKKSRNEHIQYWKTVTLNTCEMTSVLMSEHKIQMGIRNLTFGAVGSLYNMLKF